MTDLILAINTGSTSTKLGLYDGFQELITKKIHHNTEDLSKYRKVIDQKSYRLNFINDFLRENGIKYKEFKAIVGRGGLLKPIPGGTYQVNEQMIDDLKAKRVEEHASNLGGILAQALANKAGCQAFIVDPVIVDELNPVARVSGLPELEKRSVFHALNQKAIAKKYATDNHKKYNEISIIVAHLGGGISVGLHHLGKVIDVNNALCGEGPFSPNRTGGLPTFDFMRLCYSGKYSYEEMRVKLLKEGGLIGYLGTGDIREVIKMMENGNDKAKLVFEAMVYQVGKEIGSLAPVLGGKIEAIVLTGGISYSKLFTDKLCEMIDFIAPVKIYPGEEELSALAAGAYRVLLGEEEPRVYGQQELLINS